MCGSGVFFPAALRLQCLAAVRLRSLGRPSAPLAIRHPPSAFRLSSLKLGQLPLPSSLPCATLPSMSLLPAMLRIALQAGLPVAPFVIRHSPFACRAVALAKAGHMSLASSFLGVRFQRDHEGTQGDPCATGHSPRSNPERRRIDRPRSTIDRDQETAGTDWPGPTLPLPGLVRSHPQPPGPLRSRHLHLRRSIHGRSPRASVVVLHRRAKKEISCILISAPQDCHGPPAKISSARVCRSTSRYGLTCRTAALPSQGLGLSNGRRLSPLRCLAETLRLTSFPLAPAETVEIHGLCSASSFIALAIRLIMPALRGFPRAHSQTRITRQPRARK
jgi:hypothetical protein